MIGVPRNAENTNVKKQCFSLSWGSESRLWVEEAVYDLRLV